jgi:PKD repeat protein
MPCQTRLIILAIGLFILGSSVDASIVSISHLPALYVTDYGEGVSHTVNSYNLSSDQAVPDGAWMLLGTNDQTAFAMIDERKDIPFSAGAVKQFNVTNSNSYRWYYLYLQDGFTVGSTLDFHLHELTPAPVPTPHDPEPVDIVIERAPLVVILDFSGSPASVVRYNFTSSATLPANQSWQLFGTNDPGILGSDNPALFTLLDDRSGIGFTGGVPEQFAVTSPGSYLYYVFYLQSGFSASGMHLEINLSAGQVTPTPTPEPGGGIVPITPVQTPTPVSPPTADFMGNPRAGTLPLTVIFLDTSRGTTSSWSWDFGDGETSSMQSPVHMYTSPGRFTVNLSACNDAGCSWVSKSSYIYAIATGTPAPNETPRYYIRIGEETTGKTLASGETQTTGESTGMGGSTGSSTSGSGSAGSSGGQGSSGTGSTVSQESQGGQPSSHQVPAGPIRNLVDALGNAVTSIQDLLAYLQNQFHSLFR